MLNVKCFALQDKFFRMVQIFFKLANVKHNLKIQKLKHFFRKIVEKSVLLSAGEIENTADLLARWHTKFKNWHAFSTLSSQVEQLTRFWHVSLLARLLARWQVGM